MRQAGILFLILGFFAVLHTAYTLISNNAIGRGGNIPFVDNGSPIVAVVFILAGAALMYVYRTRRVK